MNETVEAIQCRLRQAGDHLAALDKAIERFIGNPKPYTTRVEFDARRSRVIVRAVDVEPVPNEIGILIGECVYQLRASLDNLVYALAVRHTGLPLPTKIEKDSAFPIRYTGPNFRSVAPPKLAGIDRRAAAIIERLQPYHRRKEPATFALRQLEELRNIDQHRLLHPVATTRSASHYVVSAPPDDLTLATDDFKFINRTLKENAMLAYFGATAHVPKPKVYVEDNASIDVAFEKTSPARSVQGQSVIATLLHITTYIRGEVLPQLLPFLLQ